MVSCVFLNDLAEVMVVCVCVCVRGGTLIHFRLHIKQPIVVYGDQFISRRDDAGTLGHFLCVAIDTGFFSHRDAVTMAWLLPSAVKKNTIQ